MTAFYEVLLDLARLIAVEVFEGVATSGSATTLIDTTLTAEAAGSPPDDYFNDGVLWILSGDESGEVVEVTDWDQTTQKFTFAALATGPTTGDEYAAIGPEFPIYALKQAINLALREIGNIPQYDVSLGDTVADQESYTLPTGIRDIRRVEIEYYDSAPYRYQELRNWEEINGTLYLAEPEYAGYAIRLLYVGPHAELSAYDDDVSPYIHRERLQWAAAKFAYRWLLRRGGADREVIAALLSQAENESAIQSNRWPVEDVPRSEPASRWLI
jgi:hypothetical protein